MDIELSELTLFQLFATVMFSECSLIEGLRKIRICSHPNHNCLLGGCEGVLILTECRELLFEYWYRISQPIHAWRVRKLIHRQRGVFPKNRPIFLSRCTNIKVLADFWMLISFVNIPWAMFKLSPGYKPVGLLPYSEHTSILKYLVNQYTSGYRSGQCSLQNWVNIT